MSCGGCGPQSSLLATWAVQPGRSYQWWKCQWWGKDLGWSFLEAPGRDYLLAPEILEQGHGTDKRKLNTFEKEFLTDLGQDRTLDRGAQSDHVYPRTSHCELGSVRSAKTQEQ